MWWPLKPLPQLDQCGAEDYRAVLEEEVCSSTSLQADPKDSPLNGICSLYYHAMHASPHSPESFAEFELSINS